MDNFLLKIFILVVHVTWVVVAPFHFNKRYYWGYKAFDMFTLLSFEQLSIYSWTFTTTNKITRDISYLFGFACEHLVHFVGGKNIRIYSIYCILIFSLTISGYEFWFIHTVNMLGFVCSEKKQNIWILLNKCFLDLYVHYHEYEIHSSWHEASGDLTPDQPMCQPG